MNNEIMRVILEFSESFFKILVPTMVTFYGFKTSAANYVLHSKTELEDVKSIKVPLELKKKYDGIYISNITSSDVKEIVLEFASFLINKYPEDVLINFYNNINEVNVKKNMFSIFRGAVGSYSYKENNISIVTVNSIYHELFHLASSHYDKENEYAYLGFNQVKLSKPPQSIGRSFDEGYTELLAHRYFGEKHPMSWAYLFEVGVAKKVEEIIGQDKMERMYLSSNLKGLIEELKKYSSEEEISNFFTTLDLLGTVETLAVKPRAVDKKVIEVYSFIFKTAINKLKMQYDNNLISYEEFQNGIDEYIANFGVTASFSGKKVYYFPTEELVNYLEDLGFDIYNAYGIDEGQNKRVA